MASIIETRMPRSTNALICSPPRCSDTIPFPAAIRVQTRVPPIFAGAPLQSRFTYQALAPSLSCLATDARCCERARRSTWPATDDSAARASPPPLPSSTSRKLLKIEGDSPEIHAEQKNPPQGASAPHIVPS